jgi:hypothetical protein
MTVVLQAAMVIIFWDAREVRLGLVCLCRISESLRVRVHKVSRGIAGTVLKSRPASTPERNRIF